jgi:hypothetical protein
LSDLLPLGRYDDVSEEDPGNPGIAEAVAIAIWTRFNCNGGLSLAETVPVYPNNCELDRGAIPQRPNASPGTSQAHFLGFLELLEA